MHEILFNAAPFLAIDNEIAFIPVRKHRIRAEIEYEIRFQFFFYLLVYGAPLPVSQYCFRLFM
jgi:hypothetical protein